jgi:hypothetical protein
MVLAAKAKALIRSPGLREIIQAGCEVSEMVIGGRNPAKEVGLHRIQTQ